jgi:hypothetical protein
VAEILARKATTEGVRFRAAGEGLYLASAIAPEYLILPLLRQAQAARAAVPAPAGQAKSGAPGGERLHPGSYFINPETLQAGPELRAGSKSKGGRHRGADWKRASRKERTKRTV